MEVLFETALFSWFLKRAKYYSSIFMSLDKKRSYYKAHVLKCLFIYVGMMSEQSTSEFSPQHQLVVSSRWNPTPEQLRALEELYRHGTRTPSADQIQQITAQLRRYGKIEGKNVFYWFQNHKARERQKRRRQMESDNHQKSNGGSHREFKILGRKETGE